MTLETNYVFTSGLADPFHFKEQDRRYFLEAPPQEFSYLLRVTRKGLGMSQKGMARELNMSQQFLSDLEHGVRKPTVAIVSRICQQLQCSAEQERAWHMVAARAVGYKV